MIRNLNKGTDWDWIQEHIPLSWTDNTSGIVYMDDDYSLCAAMICENWTPTSVECHFIMQNRKAFRNRFHYECARYVFSMGDRLKMIGIVPSNNEAALKLDRHFGFTEVARIEDAINHGVDAVILELHRDNCPYWEQQDKVA